MLEKKESEFSNFPTSFTYKIYNTTKKSGVHAIGHPYLLRFLSSSTFPIQFPFLTIRSGTLCPITPYRVIVPSIIRVSGSRNSANDPRYSRGWSTVRFICYTKIIHPPRCCILSLTSGVHQCQPKVFLF